MIKLISSLVLSVVFFSSFGQVSNAFDSLFQLGKAEFNKDFDVQDFNTSINYLEQAILLEPENPTAHYFLAYAYSRLNAKDANGLTQMQLSLTLKSSEHLELVNKLTPKYTGEIIILDPYSKLTAEWGSQAMSYWSHNKEDSAIWAFEEAKKRGGFGDFFLATSKISLELCSPNAILFTSGDNNTFPLWYLQIYEKYRTDVTVIDINLLNAQWFPTYLATNNLVNFDLTQQAMDSIKLRPWKDSLVTINDFSWTVKPSYADSFLYRGDQLFLHLLQANKFERDIYFTASFPKKTQLNLTDYLQNNILVNLLATKQEKELPLSEFTPTMEAILSTVKHLNPNSQEELYSVDNLRLFLMSRVADELKRLNNEEAKSLFQLAEKLIPEEQYPYQRENYKEYAEYIEEFLNQ